MVMENHVIVNGDIRVIVNILQAPFLYHFSVQSSKGVG